MFKKLVQSLSNSLHKQPAAAPAAKGAKPSAASKNIEPKKADTPLKKIVEALATTPKVEPAKSPDELCGIEPKWNKDQVKERLKLLYRRYNRAASSLNNSTRGEADAMLDAIVAVREKHFGAI